MFVFRNNARGFVDKTHFAGLSRSHGVPDRPHQQPLAHNRNRANVRNDRPGWEGEAPVLPCEFLRSDTQQKGPGLPPARSVVFRDETVLKNSYFRPFALQNALKSWTNFWFSGVFRLW